MATSGEVNFKIWCDHSHSENEGTIDFHELPDQ